MPLRRKKYDGDFAGGSFSTAEWGNSFSDESQVNELTPPKRTIRNYELEEDIFAEESDRDRYIITYADLITLLLGLFIILYTVSNIDTMKYEKMMNAMGSIFGKEGKPDGVIGLEYQKYEIKNHIKEFQDLKVKLNQLILENNYSGAVNFDETEKGLTIHILGDVLFSTGSSTLSSGSQDILNRISSILSTMPNNIRIEGHSDNTPLKPDVLYTNWHLSLNRAVRTAEFIMNTENIVPERISIMGMADKYPIALNDTPEGRAQNRRVDIVVLK